MSRPDPIRGITGYAIERVGNGTLSPLTTADELAAAWLLGYSGATRNAYAAGLIADVAPRQGDSIAHTITGPCPLSPGLRLLPLMLSIALPEDRPMTDGLRNPVARPVGALMIAVGAIVMVAGGLLGVAVAVGVPVFYGSSGAALWWLVALIPAGLFAGAMAGFPVFESGRLLLAEGDRLYRRTRPVRA